MSAVSSRFYATGKTQSGDSIYMWMAASVSQLQGLQAQHDHCHQAACTHFESAVTHLVGSLERVQDPGSRWLLQGLLCKACLAQAESCLFMVSKASCSLFLLPHLTPYCSLPCVLIYVSICSTESCTDDRASSRVPHGSHLSCCNDWHSCQNKALQSTSYCHEWHRYAMRVLRAHALPCSNTHIVSRYRYELTSCQPALHALLSISLVSALQQHRKLMCAVLQGDATAAADLTQAAMSDIPSHSSCHKTKKGSRNCRESRPTPSSPLVTSRHHPFEHARALHMQAKLRAACSSPMASDCITLAGCDASLAQRQHSNAEASTSAPKPPHGTGRSSSRVAKSGRGGRGTVFGSSTRAKAATAHVQGKCCHAKQCAEESGGEDLLQQAQLLLQAYQLSQGAPLLARYA